MDNLDFYQKHYFHELERRHQVTTSLSIPVGILVILIGAVTYFVSSFKFAPDVETAIFALFLTGAAVGILYCIVFLFRSYWSYEYQYLASLVDFLDYQTKLNEYYRLKSPKKAVQLTHDEFRKRIAERYAHAATRNAANNRQKSASLHKANTGLVWVVCFVLAASPIFYWQQYNNTKLVSSNSEVQMSKSDSNKGKQDKPESKPEPQKPEPPQNVNLRESEEKPTRKDRIDE